MKGMKKERSSKRKRDEFGHADGGEKTTRSDTRAHMVQNEEEEEEENEEAELKMVKRAAKKLRSEKKVQADTKVDDDTDVGGPSTDRVSVTPGRESSSRKVNKKRRKEAETSDEGLPSLEDVPRADDDAEPPPVASSRTEKKRRRERETPKKEPGQEAEVVADDEAAAVLDQTAGSKKQRFIVFVGVCRPSGKLTRTIFYRSTYYISGTYSD